MYTRGLKMNDGFICLLTLSSCEIALAYDIQDWAGWAGCISSSNPLVYKFESSVISKVMRIIGAGS